eukprot:3638331-Prymnesium_polylepis.1
MTRAAREIRRSTQEEIIAAGRQRGGARRRLYECGDLVDARGVGREPRSDEEKMEREAMAFGDG